MAVSACQRGEVTCPGPHGSAESVSVELRDHQASGSSGVAMGRSPEQPRLHTSKDVIRLEVAVHLPKVFRHKYSVNRSCALVTVICPESDIVGSAYMRPPW